MKQVISKLKDEELANFIRSNIDDIRKREDLVEEIFEKILSLHKENGRVWSLALKEMAAQGVWGQNGKYYLPSISGLVKFLENGDSSKSTEVLQQDLGGGIQYFIVAQYGKLNDHTLEEKILSAPPLFPYLLRNKYLTQKDAKLIFDWIKRNHHFPLSESISQLVSSLEKRFPEDQNQKVDTLIHQASKENNLHLVWQEGGIEKEYGYFYQWAIQLLRKPSTKPDTIVAIDILAKLFKTGYIK